MDALMFFAILKSNRVSTIYKEYLCVIFITHKNSHCWKANSAP